MAARFIFEGPPHEEKFLAILNRLEDASFWMRDGVSLSHHTRQKPLIMPTELSQLQDLESYIKLPGDLPCTKLKVTYQTVSGSKVLAFLLEVEKKRDHPIIQEGEVEPAISEVSESPQALVDEERLV